MEAFERAVESTGKKAVTLRSSAVQAWGIAAFTVIAVGGLYYAKWEPYYHKAFLAAAKHSIGASIIAGHASAPPPASWHAALEYALAYGRAVWQAMIVGLLVAAGVQTLLPRHWLARILGRMNFGSVAVAGAASAASMMWTCCAAAPVVGLRKSHVSVGAALAYWLGNTMLNPATLVFMGFVLGWNWTALRSAVGVALVFGIAYLGNRFVRPEDMPLEANTKLAALDVGDNSGSSMISRWLRALWRLCIGVIPEFVILIFVLGAARAWLFPALNPALGNSLWLLPVVAFVGTLFVIPTAGEIPIVQTLMTYGMGAAPAGALLSTLPAISLPSLLMVSRHFPRRVLIFVAGSVCILGVLAGLAAATFGF